MAGELPDDVKATLSILDQPQPTTPAKLKPTRTMDDIALPIRAPRADDVQQTLSILDGNTPTEISSSEPSQRDVEADVLKLALRKGVKSNTALAAHRKNVARKLNINPALVTTQAEESAFYQDHDPTDLQKNYPALAKYLQVDGNAELVGKNIDPLKEVETFYRRAVQDPEIMLSKGVVAAASTIVGLGDLVSLGKAGKYVEDQGIDFKKIQSVLTDLYTPEAQAALKKVAEAKGFTGTLAAAAQNPSAVGLMIGESLPQMYLGRVFGGALKAAFPSISFGTAGAAGEGITMAGGSAEQIRRETDTGELTAGQTALSVGVGVIGTGLSKFGNVLATKLGVEDVDAAMVAGKLLTRLEDSGVPKQLAVRLIGGAAVEGGVEEMPQSITEQIAQNVALGRPWDEGVPENAAIGLVTGGAMGAAAQVGAVKGKVPTTTEETPAEKQARATVQNSILRTAAAVNAEEQRNALKEWGKRVSADNPLRRESPQSFKEFVRTMADENGAIKEVFVDAKLLNETLGQAGIDKDKLAAEMPEVAESLNEALVTNGEVRIPIEDYATHIVGTPVESAIIDHLRTAPDGMTYAESQVFFQQQQDDFIKQAEALVNLNEPVLTRKEFAAQAPDGVQYKDYLAAHKNKVEVFATDLQEVHDKLLTGLESTGRFPRSISKVYAIPFREFYATNAARMGMLPSELYASLPLNFEQMSAGDILNQKAFHGSPHSFNKFSTKNIGIGEGAQAYGHGLYFTDTKTVAEHYRQAHKSNKLVFADGTDLKEASNGTEEKFAQTLLKANSGDYAKSLAENKVGENASTGDKRFAKAVEKILKDYKKKGVKAVSLSGGIYEVELAPKQDEYLLWDKPLSGQSEKVKEALKTLNELYGYGYEDTATGGQIYKRLTNDLNNDGLLGDRENFQQVTSDLMHSLGIRGIKYLDGTSRSKGEGSYNYVIFSDADVAIKQVYGQSARQTVREPLVALHNITSQNLVNVAKQGGLAAPSLAVTHTDKALTSFGDITLLADSGMVDPRYGAKVFGADVYSTRYPSVDYKFSKNAVDRLNSQLKTYYETLNIPPIESYTLNTSSREVDNELKNNPAVMAAFLETKGVKPRYVKMKKRPIAKWALKYAEQKMYSYIDTEAFRADVRKHTEHVEEILSRAKTEEEKRTMLRRIADGKAYEIDAYHRDRELFGKVDPTASASSLNSQIVLKKLSDDFATYRSNLVQGLHPEERIFKGYTATGNRRYVPHTIDEVIKIMKQGVRAGEGTLFGSGVLRAAHTPQFRSIEQIRKNADKIVTHEEFENIKTEIDNEFMSVADDLNRYLKYKPDSFYSAAVQAVLDSKSMGLNRALTENQFKDVPPEAQQRLADFITKLENLPTEYFEVKLIRRVELGEFAAAVVPKNVSPEALNILKKNGVTDIRFYKTGDNADRQAKINEFNNLFFQSAFYSALQREIPSISKIADKNGMVKADQALSWVEARQKEGKFKLEEVEAVGLKDWLQATEGKVSVADIENFVAENGVQIEETILGGNANIIATQEYEDQPEIYTLYRADDPEGQSYGSLGEIEIIRIPDGQYEINVPGFTGRVTFDTLQEALDRVGRGSAQFSETKFEAYKLPGGENYRELLLTLPKTDGQDFKSAHYDEKNILAHVRFDDRTNPTTGQKILFIEEIQSDWAQEGRKKGFIRPLTPDEKRLQTLNKKSFTDEGLSKEEEKIADDLRSRGVGDSLMSAVKGTPAAPFVQNTKSWVALAVKRMLRYAAENGYDQVAWTTGEQQAARYDLSKQISEASAISNGNGTYNLVLIDKAYNEIPPYSRSGKKLTAKEMEDLIGKELTDRLVKGADASKDKPWPKNTDTNPAFYTLRGLDLKVGGEGMLAFYDKLLPQVVSDVAKKLGGGKVGRITLQGTSEDRRNIGMFEVVSADTGESYAGPFRTREEAVKEKVGANDRIIEIGASQQPALDITPEMRDKIMSGLPLFQGQRAGFDPSTFTMSLLKGADLSSVIHEGAHFYLEALADLAGRDNAPQQIKDDFRTTLNWFGITGNETSVPGGATLAQSEDTITLYHGGRNKLEGFSRLNSTYRSTFASPDREAALSHGDEITSFKIPLDKIAPTQLDWQHDYETVKNALAAALDEHPLATNFLDFDEIYDIVVYEEESAIGEKELHEDIELMVELQALRADIAAALGYWAVKSHDEHGTSYQVVKDRDILDQRAFHGSPHDHSKFDSANIGTGEGAQAYGFGHYFAESKDVAEFYKEKLTSGENYVNGVLLNTDIPEHYLAYILNQESGDIENTRESLLDVANHGASKSIKSVAKEAMQLLDKGDRPILEYKKEKGRLYEVELAPEQDEYLLWDKPLSEQSEKVKGALSKLEDQYGYDYGNLTAGDFYKQLTNDLNNEGLLGDRNNFQQVTSELLHSLGIRGIKYLDGSSRAKGEGAYNYVIFDDKDIEIINKYAQSAKLPDTINIDGTERPTMNSEGRPIYPTEEGIRNFWKWFGDSKVVDGQGRPLVVYHGTTYDNIHEFMPNGGDVGLSKETLNKFLNAVKNNTPFGLMNFRSGSFFSPDPKYAGNYTRENTGLIYPAYIKSVNPGYFQQDRNIEPRWSGFDADKTPDSLIFKEGNKVNEIAVIDPTQIKSAIGNNGDFSVSPNILEQGGETPPAGQLPPGRTPEEIWRSMTLDQKRPYHEQWAQSYERYTMEGKAPTVEMQSVFSRFREWMLSVYKSMKDFLAQNPLAGKLNDDIRGVFDRLIASEDKIYQAEEARGYAALFGSAAEAGLSEKEFEDYQNLGKLASTRAVDEMNARSIRDMRWLSNAKDKAIKKLQAEANTKRAAIKAQVSDEVDAMPLNRARNFLTKGEFIDESGVRRESETKFKLNEAEVKAVSNGQVPDNIKGMIAPDGIGLELAAKLLGYQSPETLIGDLTNGESRDVTIQGLTDQRMLEQYGDLTDDKAIERAAEKAIHNDARARFMATGLKILSKTELSAAQLNRAAKMAAEATIAKKKIRALTPGQFTRAEAKANREAIENVARDPQKAVDAQRAALLNNRLAKAALEATEDVDSILKYFKKFDSQGVRKAIGIDQADQIDDLLQSVDRDKSTPLREIDKRQALADWVAEQEADGFEPVLDPILAEQIKTKHYKDMTVDELRMLRDTVKQIEHVGRLKQTLLTEMGRADFRARVEEAENSIRDNANRTVEERGTPTDVAGLTGQWVRQMFASHRKFSSFIREMDGGRDGGVMWRLLSKNMNAAGDSEVEMRRASSEALSGLFKGFTQDKTPLNLYAKRMRIPGTDIAMTQEQRIMFAMNWGNEGNRQRLLDGGITGKRALSINDANAILDTLTKPEWDFVQGVWDHIATYKDQIAALERKITGIEPEWVEPVEIKTKHGTYRGGYFPAKYDIELSSRSESLEAAVDMRMGMKGAFNTAATRSGYTKARSEAVMNRPLLLSYNVIANHISEVTHRLAWQPWLIDANRVLKALDAPIREHYGAEVLREMRNTVIDIAAGDVGARTPMERAINHLRTGSTIVGMGWRFSTAFLQPSGLAQSWARIGGRWMTKGIAETFKNLNSASELVNSKSSLMKNRDITMNREVRDVLDRIRTTEGINAVTGSYFSLIGKMQRVVDIPTWLGAYEKALHDMQYEHAVDSEQRAQIESDAVAMADQAVIDSQSGGQIKDLASIQRGHPGLKLFTNFYSYFSATYNLNIEALRRTNFRSPTDVALLAGDLVLLNIIPVLFATALKEMTKGKCGDDLDCLVKSYGYEQAGYMFGQMVLLRDMGSAALVAAGGDQYGYSGPAGLRFFSDLYKAGVQANQGELDWPLFKSVSNTAGVLLHFPMGQVNTTLEGIMAVENGDVEGVSILPALLFGPPKEGK